MKPEDMGMPDVGITALMAMAYQHHELYEAWVRAGFTEEQAFSLLTTVISSAVASMAKGTDQ